MWNVLVSIFLVIVAFLFLIVIFNFFILKYLVKTRSYWGAYSKYNKSLAQACLNLMNNRFILVDGGAAGQISEPFDIVKNFITSIRIEPRGEEVISMSNNDIHINAGLWEKDKAGVLHIAKEPSRSSIYPPNINFLEQFDDNYGVKFRKTEKKNNISLRSIDSLVKNNEIPLPHFIKLDVHSSELSALKGAKNSLKNCIGLLVETWNSEIHLGQGLHYEIEKFGIENGFEVYDIICAARWKVKHNNKISNYERSRYIGSEILLIKKTNSEALLFHKTFLFCLFGFYSDALNLVSKSSRKDAKNLYKKILNTQLKINRSLLNKLRKIKQYIFN